VHNVLEKLQPDMIALDAQFVGKVDRAPSEVIAGAFQPRKQTQNPLQVRCRGACRGARCQRCAAAEEAAAAHEGPQWHQQGALAHCVRQ
jgi:hypothetical protein